MTTFRLNEEYIIIILYNAGAPNKGESAANTPGRRQHVLIVAFPLRGLSPLLFGDCTRFRSSKLVREFWASSVIIRSRTLKSARAERFTEAV